jgi:GT2 family glycosyltransferase
MVKGFDENFFLDMEDLDISYSLHLAGVALAQINLPLMHQLGGSFDQLGISRDSITQQSLSYFLQKWNLHRRDTAI